jgi:hypothetical protein
VSPVLGAPGAYEAWVGWLDAYARGEDLPAGHLQPVDERMGPHMQERLVRRIAAAFETRARRWGDTLTRHLGSATVRRPAELAAALVAARGRLRPLQILANDPRLPEAVRAGMTAAMTQMVHEAQDSLERSARRQLGSSEQLLAVLRQNTLVAVPPPVPSTTSQPPSSPPGRRVIL